MSLRTWTIYKAQVDCGACGEEGPTCDAPSKIAVRQYAEQAAEDRGFIKKGRRWLCASCAAGEI